MVPILAQTSGSESDSDLVSDIGSEIKVAVDRWSAGQIGLADVAIAGGVIVAAVGLGWVVRRLAIRWTANMEGAASTASLVLGQVLSFAIYILGAGIVLEVLGFGLGPILVVLLTALVAILFLRPLIQNLSSGLLIQLRGPYVLGDLIETNGVRGVVEEVSARTTILVTSDGRTVHVPNNDVLDHVLVNLSTIGRRRSELVLHAAPDTDVERLAERVQAAISTLDPVLDEPPPTAEVTGFVGGRPRLRALYWHRPESWAERVARDRVARAVAALIADEAELALADEAMVIESTGGAGS